MQPVKQTAQGVSVPPAGPQSISLPPNVPVPVDGGLTVIQHARPGAITWDGKPALATLAYPDSMAVIPLGFNKEGYTSLAQTFTLAKDLKLSSLSLFAGDGMDADSPITLGLYDLGIDNVTTDLESYQPGTNLLGSGKGLRIAYTVQAPGLFTINLDEVNKPELKAGHKYLFELQGKRKSVSIFWRCTQSDVYDGGAAYLDYKLLKNRNGKTADFALAIYESK
jgi:hypothetical protein